MSEHHPTYNPFDWYWYAEDGRIFSSSRQRLVTQKDRDFAAWKKDGNVPQRWPVDEAGVQTDDALQDVLKPYGLNGPEKLADLKQRLTSAIDAAAEAERLKYITPGSGQGMTYLAKAEEARKYLSEPDPDPAGFPLLAVEAGIRNATFKDVAEIIVTMNGQWLKVAAAIEGVRLGAKVSIEEANNQDEAEQAFRLVQWPVI